MSQLFAGGGQNWSLSFSIIPSKEIPGLISFRMDWLDLLAVQGNLLKVRLQRTGKKCSEYVMCFLILPKGIPLDLVTSLKSPRIYLVSSCRKPNFSKFY